jgi:hypothetical protein
MIAERPKELGYEFRGAKSGLFCFVGGIAGT